MNEQELTLYLCNPTMTTFENYTYKLKRFPDNTVCSVT